MCLYSFTYDVDAFVYVSFFYPFRSQHICMCCLWEFLFVLCLLYPYLCVVSEPSYVCVELFFHSLANYVISSADCCFAGRGLHRPGLHGSKITSSSSSEKPPWTSTLCVCVCVCAVNNKLLWYSAPHEPHSYGLL